MTCVKETRLGRPATLVDSFVYIHTKDHDGVTFVDQRSQAVAVRKFHLVKFIEIPNYMFDLYIV